MSDFSRRLSDLSDDKQSLLQRVLRRDGLDATVLPVRPRPRVTMGPHAAPNPSTAPLPLTHTQESLWFMCQLGGSSLYNLPSGVRLTGALDVAALERTFREIVRRHEALRTCFPSSGGRPRQEISPEPNLAFRFVPRHALPEHDREAAALRLAAEEGARPFDLALGPLMRVSLFEIGPDDHLLALTHHHLIWDGWSIGVMMREMAVLYHAFSTGRPSPLPELSIQYADYAIWQREALSGDLLSGQIAYWRERLSGLPKEGLPTDRPRAAVPKFSGAVAFVDLPPELGAALDEIGRRADATPFMTLLCAFQIVLARWTGNDRAVVGTPTASRRRREIEGLIGHFANLLVLATDMGGEPTFNELLARVKEVTAGAYANQDVPFEVLVDKLQIERDPAKNPLFQVMFAVHPDTIAALELPGLRVSPVNLGAESSHFDLGLHLWRSKYGIKGYVSYDKDLYDAATIERMIGHYGVVLEAIAADPDRPVASIPMLAAGERTWLAARGRAAVDPSDIVAVHEAIASRAEATPEATAVTWAEPSGDIRKLGFSALLARARHLAGLGKPASERAVGVSVAAGPHYAAAILAALDSGSPLVPIDPEWSIDRIAAIIADAGVSRILVDAASSAKLSCLGVLTARVDAPLSEPAAGAAPEPRPALDIDAPAYLSYASGARVTVSHRALARRMARLGAELSLSPGEALVATAPPAGDFFPIEILWPLSRGASVVFGANVAGEPVRAAHFTPSGLASFLESWPADSPDRLAGVSAVLLSAAAPRPDLTEALRRRVACRSLHLYAPPEIACEVSVTSEPAADKREPAAAGTVLLLDGQRRRVPIGVRGTVCVTPAGAAELADPVPAGAALVATPDEACWLADGTLKVVGSSPRTLWSDGVRLDLSEVESALLRHAAVDACHVMKRGEVGREELVANVVASAAVTQKQLHDHLSPLLPARAVKVSFVQVTSLPRDPDGAVDTPRLAELPVIDAELIDRWQNKIDTTGVAARSKVIAGERMSPRGLRHVSDLLPGWRPGKAAERTTTTTSGSVAAGEGGTQRLAYARGPALHIPDDAPKTLSMALLRSAESEPGHGLTIVQGSDDVSFLSYADLVIAARRVLGGLRARGLAPRDRVILQLDHLRDYFTAFWACVLGGITPVTVATSPAYDRKNGVLGKLYNVWELLKRPAIITSSQLVAPLSGVPALYDVDPAGGGFKLLAIEALAAAEPAESLHEADPGEVVFCQLTSGSTGVPKCIQETHRGIIHHVHAASLHNGYGRDDVTLNWLPMDHVVPLLTSHIKDTCNGARQVHVKTDLILADPLEWLRLIQAHRVTHTWSPNFGYKLVNDALARTPDARCDLSSMKIFLNAGEQVTVPVAEEFLRRTAPFGVRRGTMQPAFGMAEIATGVAYSNDWATWSGYRKIAKSSLAGMLEEAVPGDPEAIEFVDLGPVIPGNELRIVGADGQVVPEFVIGQLQIRSVQVTPGYLYNDEANREAFAGDGWFNSGDLAFLKDGRLTITGRQKEMIIVRGANFYCYELEDAVGALEGVEPTFVGVSAVDDPATGTDGLAVFFAPKAPGIDVALLRSIKERVTADFGVSPSYVIPVPKETFPKTTSGKIQRTQLKRDLIAGAFDATLKAIDLALENENTIPDWFHREVWVKSELAAVADHPRWGEAVVFLDRDGLGEALAKRLGDAAVRVEVGSSFTRIAPRRFALNPGSPEQNEALFAALAADRIHVDRVFHLLTSGPAPAPATVADIDRAESLASASLLSIARALTAAQGNARPVRILVASNHSRFRKQEERIAWERAAVRGLVKTIPQEWPHLECRHIDLPAGDLAANVDYLHRESRAATRERDVMYRGCGRWASRHEVAQVSATGDPPFQRGDLVLITGGLGGVGAEIARYLLEQHGARLLLTGRTPLDDSDAPREEADSVAARANVAERRKAFQDLRRGGEVLYEVADVCDPAAMRAAIERAQTHFGQTLAGVIHLAGVLPTRLLAEETPESLFATLAPRLGGALVIDEILGNRGFFIALSSVYGRFGGVAAGGYASANSALEAFVEERRRRGLAQSYCLAFSHWEDLGMSRGYLLAEQSRAQGYDMIGARRGLHSLMAALRSPHRELLIGVDGSRPNVRRHLVTPLAPAERLVAYVVPAAGKAPTAELSSAVVPDRFGTPSRCEVVEVTALPLTACGEVDVAALAGLAGGRAATAERVLPRTGLERTIAAVWRDVLGVESIDVNTSFFALGGQSILLVQVLAKLKQALSRELTVVELFRYPTVSALARYLEKDETAKPSREKAAERAQKQREAMRQRVAPRPARPQGRG